MRNSLLKEINALRMPEQPMYDAEKERIMLHLKKEIRKKHPMSLVLRTLSAAAACFALLITASAFSPVLAENIPFMQEIVSFLKQEETPISSILRGSEVKNYMQPVTDETKDELQIIEAYCDGTALVVTAGLEMPGVDENILRIVPSVTVDINSERLFPVKNTNTMQPEGDGQRLGMFILHRTEGDRFVGALSVDVSHLELSEKLSFTLTLTELTGENPKLMVAQDTNVYDPVYSPKQYALNNVTAAHTVDIAVDTSLRREYTVEESVEQLTVHKLITTPTSTFLNISQPEDAHYYYTVETDGGTALGYSKFDNAGTLFVSREDMKLYRDPLPEGTKSVQVTVYSLTDYTTPIGTVDIPVESGYAVPETKYTVAQIPEDEIVYDPPLEELLALQPEAELYTLGEAIVTREGREPNADAPGYVNENATAEITYSNMQVYDSPADIGLSANDLSSLFRDSSLTQEGRNFVTFDVTLKTQGIYGYRFDDESYRTKIENYSENDGTAGILWINNYAVPEALTASEPHLSGEAAYFSAHSVVSSNYYHFVTNAYDTHTFVLGFYVPEELLETGNWRIGIATGEDDPNVGAEYAYYSIPPVTLEN